MESQTTVLPQISAACELIWGPAHSTESEIGNIFEQWSQGFTFSDDCKSALVQEKGGPCAVIVPAQAYIIKYLLFDSEIQLVDVTDEQRQKALERSLQSILLNVASDTIHIAKLSQQLDGLSSVEFHKQLILQSYNSSEIENHIGSLTETWCQNFGVMSFLYSIVLTRGVENVISDIGIMGDPSLVDNTFGHGNQSLLNLILTGVATPNVFDYTRSIDGMDLMGVAKKNDIGFLTLLEALRYCKVGDFLKCPEYPIWIIGSESHLSLLFSTERSLCVSEDSPFKVARAAFDTFDCEGNGFIPVTDLPNVLEKLEMVSEEEYVEFMKERLDPDSTGIILFPAFIEEFVPGALEKQDDAFQNKQFVVHHYNGLKQSNSDRKVAYRLGAAAIYMEYSQVMEASTAPTPLLRVLRTKWPTIEIDWQSQPSIS